jgi:hypothetical protein
MSRHLSYLFALLLVADAIAVNGRGPRPVTISGQVVIEVTRLTRLQAATVA